MPSLCLSFDVPPFRLSGAVYTALLNHPGQLAALAEAVHQPPYKAPPQAPVLAVQPRHTLAADGDVVLIPRGIPALEIGASLGIVIGRTACRVPEAAALQFVAGYTVANTLNLPLASHYRPAVRQRARDGFCPIGPRITPAAQVAAPDALVVRVQIDGALAWQGSTAGRLRSVARLLADVSEFMTLQPGDLLLLGVADSAPQASAGQRVSVEIDGLGRLNNRFMSEAA